MITSLSLADLPPPTPGGAVVSIGVFDGVHLGHQAILAANVAAARALGARPTVATFASHPKNVLLGRAPRTLTTLEHRLEHFRRAGIDHTVVLEFDAGLRDTPAEDFARELVRGPLAVRRFVLGFDSKFGKDRRGTPALLAELGYEVEVVPKVVVGERAVSSTAIREAVELGDLDGAARMLGRPVSVFGEVVRGDELGRRLGFPTANLDLHHELHPPPGVYAGLARRVPSRAFVAAGGPSVEAAHPAVSNIGYRPTVEGERPGSPRVEVHLIGFEGDLYGEHIELEFAARLRGERRFPDLAALTEQIGRDVETARELLLERFPEL